MNIEFFKNQDDFFSFAKKEKKYFLFIPSLEQIDLNSYNEFGLNITGAIFPDIIYKNKSYTKGLLALELSLNMQLNFIKNLTRHELDINEYLNVKSVITITEGFNKNNDAFLYRLFEILSFDTNILGGSAGLLYNKEKKKVFFDNSGFYDDCAVLIGIDKDMKVSANHGWDNLDGPFIVTSTNNYEVKTIDYRPAFQVYKEVLEKNSQLKITDENLDSILKKYPLGVVKYQSESLVKDIINVRDNSLHLASNIGDNTIINILKGNKKNIINASKNSIQESLNKEDNCVLVFNCITRKIFLEDRFNEELDAIYNEVNSKCVVGVSTLGEVANCGNKNIHILNKTCVVGSLCS